jgi:N6-adenosine-specific RNA methylase IME4
MTPLPFHRYADIFPLIEGEELRDLAEDIRLYGVRKPIDILERAVLDGRNRHNALLLLLDSGAPRGAGWGAYEGQPLGEDDFDLEAGLPWFRKYSITESGDPLDYVWSLNFARRHLSASQRAACAAEYEGYRHGGAREPSRSSSSAGRDDRAENQQPANLPLASDAPPAPAPMTQAERAEKLGVSERIVRDADKVHERSPELHQAVKDGAVTADVAAALVEKPAEQVKELLDSLRGPDGKLLPDAQKALRPVVKEMRAEAQQKKTERRAEREVATGQQNLSLAGEEQTFGVIVADPEWDFTPYSRETGMDRHAANHYATTPLDKIKEERRALFDRLAAKNCVLGLWVADLKQGIEALAAFGFEYRSYRVWVKDVVEYEFNEATRHALKLPAGRFLHVCGPPGTGFWGTSRAEIMVFGVRGDVPAPPMGRQGENVWFAARPHIEGTNVNMHSAKPEDCFDWFDTHYPSYAKVELNARAARPGWKRWGLEAPRGEGWIGPVPAKFAPDESEPQEEIADEGDGALPPFPWSALPSDSEEPARTSTEASDAAAAPEPTASAEPTERPPQLGVPSFLRQPGEAAHAAEEQAESDNEAAEAAGAQS